MKRLVTHAVLLAALAAVAASAATTATAAHAKGKVQTRRGQALTIVVKSDAEHGKKGPDGKWHDAFLPASFDVRAGTRTEVTILNYDGGPHSLVSPSLGLNVQIPAAKGSTPGRVTFALDPKKAGRYDWWCGSPCDPWAMTHDGYMRGFVTATH